jgi:hypothetical protein
MSLASSEIKGDDEWTGMWEEAVKASSWYCLLREKTFIVQLLRLNVEYLAAIRTRFFLNASQTTSYQCYKPLLLFPDICSTHVSHQGLCFGILSFRIKFRVESCATVSFRFTFLSFQPAVLFVSKRIVIPSYQALWEQACVCQCLLTPRYSIFFFFLPINASFLSFHCNVSHSTMLNLLESYLKYFKSMYSVHFCQSYIYTNQMHCFIII